FAILFNSPRSTLFACFLGGALGHALRETLLLVDLPAALATLFAAGAIGVFAELIAHRRGCPAGLFSVPAAIPMVPGVFAFRGMMAFINVAARPESNAV